MSSVFEAGPARARRWRAAGGQVMGYLGEGIPEALLAAAGFLPFRIASDAAADLTALDRYVYPILSKTLSGRGMFDADRPKQILAMMLSGQLDFIDHLLVARGRSADTMVYDALRELRRRVPGLHLPTLHLLDRARVTSYHASVFNRGSIAELAERLGAKDLGLSVTRYNRRAELLAEISRHRHADPPLVSGARMLSILSACWTLPVDEAIALLEQSVGGVPRSGQRLFLAGSAIDSVAIYEAIEATGATIVGESHAWGELSAAATIATDLDPIDALAESSENAPRSFRFPLDRHVREIVGQAKEVKAEVALIYIERGDESAGYEVPDLLAAFAAAGIRALHLADQMHGDTETVARAIAAFLPEHARR